MNFQNGFIFILTLFVYKGLISPADFPRPYKVDALTNIFQVAKAGNYTLAAKGRILRINNDETLSVVEIPPVRLKIHLTGKDVPEVKR